MKSFKHFLTEKAVSFYTLYNTEFPSKKVKAEKDPKKKKEKLDQEATEYNKLLTKFLMNVSSMN